MASPRNAGANNPKKPEQAASSRRAGICAVRFGDAATKLFDNGHQPLPIVPREKRPAPSRWSSIPIDGATVERWAQEYATYGIGLRTGTIAGIDIDIIEPDLAHRVDRLVRDRLGDTLTRVGFWPKRLLPYRTEEPFPKITCGNVEGAKVEFLGLGQQFVAFGIHPQTGRPYYWLDGTPLDVPFEALPRVDRAMLAALKVEIGTMLPAAPRRCTRAGRGAQPTASSRLIRNETGRVIDGRDGWLSTIAYHAVHDALAAGGRPDRQAITRLAWQQFDGTTEIGRPKASGACYGWRDAERKVADKLRLAAQGRLPSRDTLAIEAAYVTPTLSVEEARRKLDAEIQAACARIAAWHAEPAAPPPQIGIRATVGIGKSLIARRHLLALRERLIAAKGPSRIVVFVPTHELAEEAAAAWRNDGARAAVLRGYRAAHPATREPMCRDLEMVEAAVAARLGVHETACAGSGRECAYFKGCLKQQNRAEVAAAEVVMAAHDALFTGFGIEPSSIGAVLIDEGFWQRAARESHGLTVESFAFDLLGGSLRGQHADDFADLHDLRTRAVEALRTEGPVARSTLLRVGLDEESCRLATQFEERRLRDPGLVPGLAGQARKMALAQVQINQRTDRIVEVWRAMQDVVAGDGEHEGRMHVRPVKDGLHEIVVTGLKAIHPTLRDKPVLYIDATLQPDLARCVLHGLELREIDAATPNASVRLVMGNFGKGQLCVASRLDPQEAQRRRNRLGEAVDYVRWQARRAAPILLVTYKDIEDAFRGIRGVEVAHFNAIAGLDAYRDVRLLIVVGRPLPSDADLDPLSGAFFCHRPTGGYQHAVCGVRMRDGSTRTVRVAAHADEKAELLRAAICDDEMLQAIGRGRGVNRSADDPLEVHVLADVALPLVHDEIVGWENVRPDLFQRMLLAGIAVDSPADAAALHPDLFSASKQAQKAMERAGFKRQNPMSNPYREMSLKSATYRRPGRGCAWQRAWWIDDTSDVTQSRLEAAFGALAEWSPDA